MEYNKKSFDFQKGLFFWEIHFLYWSFLLIFAIVLYRPCTVQYASFDGVVDMISKLGSGALFIRKTRRQNIPVDPADFDLLGFSIDGLYYVDKCLPIGCSISCKLWETFATFLHWLTQYKTGLDTLDHYLDDFIFAGKGGSQDCAILMTLFTSLTKEI